MKARLQRTCAVLALVLLFGAPVFASAYNARPKLVVIIVVDQMRGDFLARWHDSFGPGGFRLLLDHGANFTDCNYDYANTHTAAGHSTLLTGAYVNGHGIFDNEWWDAAQRKVISAVDDPRYKIVGLPDGTTETGVSPHYLLASTLGDEMKLATQGKSRVYSISLKDYSAVLSAGHAADAAFWPDKKTGDWVTSSYYRDALPAWAAQYNAGKPLQKYEGKEWKDRSGEVVFRAPREGEPKASEEFSDTPFANEYEFDFARELVTNEKLGRGAATDLLVLCISAPDVLGHRVGPDSPKLAAMYEALNQQLAGFFSFLGDQVGLANVWIALSADHGIAPIPAEAQKLRIPAVAIDGKQMTARINADLSAKLTPGRITAYLRFLDWPIAYLDATAFAAAKIDEATAERMAGDALMHETEAMGAAWQGYVTRAQQAAGQLTLDEWGRRYAHSYSPEVGWYVIGRAPIFSMTRLSGTTHGLPYTYDTHVPLVLFGLAFRPGTYRTRVEPVDLAPTLASLLDIDAPTHSIGRVLTEAVAPSPQETQQ